MTQRPRSHEISSLAVSSVMREWIKSGAAVEEVQNDYGEDLLVQTSLNGGMDECKIWVQVKGKENVRISSKTGKPAPVQVSHSHALRWTSTTDLTIVTLWDVSRDIGWYAIPKDWLNYSSTLVSQKRHIGIPFHKDDHFNSTAAAKLTWRARIQHANQLIMNSSESFRIAGDVDSIELMKQANAEAKATAFMFLIRAGILNDGKPSRAFTDQVKKTLEYTKSIRSSGPPLSLEAAVMHAIMLFLQERQGIGEVMPTPLVDKLTSIMAFVYREVEKPDFAVTSNSQYSGEDGLWQ